MSVSLETRDLTIRFGGHVAVDHVSCVFRPGELTAIAKAKSTDTEKLIAAMEGMEFDTPKGKMMFRKEDHQALQSMYAFKVSTDMSKPWARLELTRELKIEDMNVPIRNKR